MKTEIIYDMPEDEYHASTGLGEGQFVTRSMLAYYAKDPRAFYYRYKINHPLMVFAGNEGTRFGTYVESYLLDKDVSMYTTRPKLCWSRAKNEQVNWSLYSGQFVDATEEVTTKQWKLDNQNIVSDADLELAQFMELRFADTAIGKWWLGKIEESQKQVTIRWTEGGLNLQIRIDCYLPDVFVSDLKSTAKRIEDFNGTAARFGYDMQNAIYSDAVTLATGKQLPFIFAVGETTELRRADILKLPDMQVQYARAQYKKAIRGIAAEDYSAIGHDRTEPTEYEPKPWELYTYMEEE